MVSETHENNVFFWEFGQRTPLSPLGTEKSHVKIDQFLVKLSLYGEIYRKSIWNFMKHKYFPTQLKKIKSAVSETHENHVFVEFSIQYWVGTHITLGTKFHVGIDNVLECWSIVSVKRTRCHDKHIIQHYCEIRNNTSLIGSAIRNDIVQ